MYGLYIDLHLWKCWSIWTTPDMPLKDESKIKVEVMCAFTSRLAGESHALNQSAPASGHQVQAVSGRKDSCGEEQHGSQAHGTAGPWDALGNTRYLHVLIFPSYL